MHAEVLHTFFKRVFFFHEKHISKHKNTPARFDREKYDESQEIEIKSL